MSINKTISIIAILVSVGAISVVLDKKEEYRQDKSQVIPKPPGNNFSNIKSWNYQEKKWETYDTNPKPSRNYSDEEIRILREKQSFKSDGSYIYTPGRHVPTYKEVQEKAIKDYIDKHGDEIYEELEDKYGN